MLIKGSKNIIPLEHEDIVWKQTKLSYTNMYKGCTITCKSNKRSNIKGVYNMDGIPTLVLTF